MNGIETLLARLDLETLDRDLFRGTTPNDGRPRVFGGLVAAQALVAAVRTVEGRRPHSLHSYFLRPGDPKRPIIYEVDRIRDGSSFTTRRVVAIQQGEAIFNMAVSFQTDEVGFEHQDPMPEAPAPESLPTSTERLEQFAAKSDHPAFPFLLSLDQPIDHRDADPIDLLNPTKHEGPHRYWFKARGRLADDPTIHQCVMTYASDIGLLDTSVFRHGRAWLDPKLIVASLDHAIWFHRAFRADEWLLYVTTSPAGAGGRGFNLGRVYTHEGALVASVAQESLVRERTR